MFDSSQNTETIIGTDESRETKIFHRGIGATIAGLFHLVAGFLNTLFSVIRILIIGYAEPFAFSRAIGIFNLSFESLSIILWISGIGILRSKRWGLYAGAAWALLTILFHITARIIRAHYWGDLAAPLGWGEYLVVYYALGFLAATGYIVRRKKP
jgi:hypothetical protein